MYLLIDDLRDIPCDIIARTSEAAKGILNASYKHLECVIFDHDLGEHSKESGYDVMVWMFNQGIFPAKVQLVTSNPVGRDNMKALLLYRGYEATADGTTFTRKTHMLDKAVRKYAENPEYVTSMGLRNAEPAFIHDVKAYLDTNGLPYIHRTEGLPFNGVIVMGAVKDEKVKWAPR